MMRILVYKRDELLGETDVCLLNQEVVLREKDIKITHFSQPSERCPPLAVLHTVSSSGLCLKMESKMLLHDSPLFSMHLSCLRENKTAVMPLEGDELHLVALMPRSNGVQYPCFWGFIIPSGIYSSCLAMLNLRCLGIVFDLDETLIVANTMRSFEDRIEALKRKINTEIDPQRISGMLAEVKRYQDDKMILKQYAENDYVLENGKIMRIQPEVVPPVSDNHQSIIRPIVRLQDKNIVLTRINPVIRDTSVLVRLRPAWEELRSYLTARGRKRFDVYVCTMAERDYALEMWRLLDPDYSLINSKQLLDRIVCVKSGSKKSLFNVFQNGTCDPKMALVIDDRLKVWDEKDQPRVHVVPAFAPYSAHQAEENTTIPVLCVARNVACNVRGGFFRDFDDHLLKQISGVSFENDLRFIPSPDVGNYLVSEDECAIINGNKDVQSFDGMAGAEVERRLKEAASTSSTVSSSGSILDPRTLSSTQCTVAPSHPSTSLPPIQRPTLSFPSNQILTIPAPQKQSIHVDTAESSIQGSSAREEGEVPESELDPDTRRRLLILHHGQDTREHSSNETSYPVGGGAPLTVSPPTLPSCASWFPPEEVMSPGKFNEAVNKRLPLDMELVDKHKPLQTSSGRTSYGNQRLNKEMFHRGEHGRLNHLPPSYRFYLGGEVPPGQQSRDEEFEFKRRARPPSSHVNALHKIAMQCGTKVEYKPSLVDSIELQFHVEAWFSDRKVAEGIGRTRREAQSQAAEEALKSLAYKYVSSVDSDPNMSFNNLKDNGFSIPSDPRLDASRRSLGSVSALNGGEADTVLKEEIYMQDSSMRGKQLKPDVARVTHRIPSSLISQKHSG